MGGAAEAATGEAREPHPKFIVWSVVLHVRCHTEVVVAATKKAATVVAVTVHHEGVNNLDILS